MNNKINEISGSLRDFIELKAHDIAPSDLTNSEARYNELVELYKGLKGSFISLHGIHNKLESIRDQIPTVYFDQHTEKMHTMLENCRLVLSALRYLETQVLSVNPEFVTLVTQPFELL